MADCLTLLNHGVETPYFLSIQIEDGLINDFFE